MKCLITGGAGFIGSHLADRLIASGHEVIIVDDLSTGRAENIESLIGDPCCRFIEGSILDETLLDAVMAGCDEVYHLAAAVGVRLILERPCETMRTNMAGTEIVIRLAAQHGLPLLFASSSEVYGRSNGEPLAETHQRIYGGTDSFRWAYAGAKALGESMALAAHATGGLHAVVARLFNVIGPRQRGCHGMVLPTFVEQSLAGAPITVYGSGRQTRCFAHVADVADALIRLLRTSKGGGQIVNLGGDEPIAINDLARLVRRIARSRSTIQHLPYEAVYPTGFQEIEGRRPDLQRAHALLGPLHLRCIDDIVREVVACERHRQTFRNGVADR